MSRKALRPPLPRSRRRACRRSRSSGPLACHIARSGFGSSRPAVPRASRRREVGSARPAARGAPRTPRSRPAADRGFRGACISGRSRRTRPVASGRFRPAAGRAACPRHRQTGLPACPRGSRGLPPRTSGRRSDRRSRRRPASGRRQAGTSCSRQRPHRRREARRRASAQ